MGWYDMSEDLVMRNSLKIPEHLMDDDELKATRQPENFLDKIGGYKVGDPKVTLPVVGLPKDPTARKALPVFSGFMNYFPDAMVAVCEASKIGNEQHNPGMELFWDRSKSGDELDALARHLLQAGTIDTDGIRHSTKVAWRAMANLQKELEQEKK